MMDEVICKGYRPGVIGRMAEPHATYYHENWGFGLFFEAQLATDLSEFLGRYDGSRDGFWTLSLNRQIEGGIAIDGIKAMTEGAHLRWFILSGETRGRGFGNRLMAEAISFCKKKNYGRGRLVPYWWWFWANGWLRARLQLGQPWILLDEQVPVRADDKALLKGAENENTRPR